MKLSSGYFPFLILLVQLLLSPLVIIGQTEEQESSTSATPLEPEVEDPDEEVGLILFSDESPLQVLDMLERLTDRIVLRRQDVASSAKINFNSRGPLTKEEAVLAMESLLTLNGIMLTNMGDRFMKAVLASNVNSHVPEMIVGSTFDLDPSQQIYAKLFKLDYLQAEITSGTTITPLLSQNSSVVIFQKSNAILVTDALLNLQRIEHLLDQMDKPQDVREEIRFVKLNFVQASDMQQRIDNLIQGPLKSYLEGNTSVTADERTNQLILITHPGNLEVIMNIVESVDVDAAPLTSSEVFPLRQAKAEEVVPIIEEIISGQQEGREKDAQTGSSTSSNSQTIPPQPVISDTAPAPTTVPTPATVAANLSSSLANSSLQFSNVVGLSADERTNSIVAYGTHQDLKTLKGLIEKIDIPLPQVRIEVIITEVTLSEDQASGLSSFSLDYNDRPSAAADPGTGPVILDLDSISLASEIGKFTLDAVLAVSENNSNVKILSTPTIVVSHNEEGRINVSESRPFRTGSVGNNTLTFNNQIEYRDVGIQLTVTPLIGSDGSVTMTIEQTVDTVSPETRARDQQIGNNNGDDDDQTSTVDETPIIGKREANSTITVNNKEVIILGGLQQNQRDVNNIIFPVLGRVPLLKNILNSRIVEYNRTELIIFVRPTVLKTPDEANAMSEEMLDILEDGEGVRQYMKTGTVGNIHMEGSRFNKEVKAQEQLD